MSDASARVANAEREAHAALAIADDPLGPRSIARDHILAGWRLLLAAHGSEPDVDLTDAKLPWTNEAAQTRLRALQPDDDPIRAAADLARAVANAQRELGLAPRPRPWRRIAATSAAVLALGIAAAIAINDDGDDGPWRGSYFDNEKLEGVAIERREGDVRFYWHVRAPIDGVPADGFSARFETCLVLEHAVPEAAFQIGSDDGARVLVEDTIVVDDWIPHRYRSRGWIGPLDAGVHRLTVEFFDREREATLVLVASLDGDVPKEIPTRLLRLPAVDGSCARQ